MKCGSSEFWRLVVLASILIAVAPVASAIGILAQPANFYLNAAAGSVVEAQLTLFPTASDFAVAISLSPFTIDDHGQPRICRCRSDRALVEWTDLSVNRLLLLPGNRNVVTIRIAVPPTAEGTYWSAVLIDGDVASPVGGVGASVRPRLAIPVFISVEGTDFADVKLGQLAAFRDSDGSVVVSGTVRNSGNTLVHAPLILAVEDDPDSSPVELASVENAVITVLPGGKRVFRLRIAGEFAAARALRVTAWVRFGSAPAAVAEGSCAVTGAPPCDVASCLAT